MNLKAISGQFHHLWSALSRVQRASIAVAALAVIAGVLGFSQWRKTQDFKPLYTGMTPEDAAQVVGRLKESNIEYKVADNGSAVSVPSARVTELRLEMAAAGLPKSGRIGFELFDKTNLGATDFAEQVNFRRALEGELERSIRSVAEVEQARVHLTFAKDSVFLDSKTPAKASVLLRLKPGTRLAPVTGTAIANLVASAVEGLTPAAVSIMDSEGNLLLKPKNPNEMDGPSDEVLEYRRSIERDLLAKANSTLEPLLGAGRYRIGLSVDCDFSSGEQSDEVYDPEKSVMTTSQKTEETNAASSAGGVPGTASNLPRSPARTAGTGSTMMRRTENVAYQSSRMVRRVKLPQGNIRRISASVLLDQATRWENTNGSMQRVLVPPSAESVRAIRDLVSAAIGFVPSRGDQIVVESLPFETTLHSPPPPVPQTAQKPGQQGAPASRFALPAWAMDWRVQVGVGAGVLVIIAGLVFFLRKRKKRRKAAAAAVAHGPVLHGAEKQGAIASETGRPAVEGDPVTQRAIAEAQEKVAQTAHIEHLVEQLRNTIQEDPALAASVLRTWLQEVEG